MSNSRKSFRKLALVNNVSSTSTPSINLLANSALSSSYNLTLPSTVPTIAGQSLISDTTGNLSWGSATATVSTFTGTANPVTAPTNVTGLVFTASFSTISVYVAINATTNIYSLYNLKVYQKGSASSWGLAYDVICDTDDVDPQVLFTVTSGGQIQYTLPSTFAGFSSIVMMWTLGVSVSNTLTSLALSSTLNVGGASTFTAGIQGTSLALSSTFNVSGLATHGVMTGLSLLLANAATSGSISTTVGSFFNVQPQTYTDNVTAASGTAAGAFSASYLGIPTLAATNTSVTTTTASTLTIAGPPATGTNETLTNSYALNILSGNIYVNGYTISSNMPSIVFGGTNTTQSSSSGGNTLIASNVLSIVKTTGATMGTTGSNVITIPRKGIYAIRMQLNLTALSPPSNVGLFMLGNDGNYYAVTYAYASSQPLWLQTSACEELPAGLTLTPYVYNIASINAANATYARITVTGITMTL